MVGPELPDGCAYIAGDGDYDIEVISESRHQDRLEWLTQGRGEERADYACTAVLEYEPDNPFDVDAVSVSVNGVRIGYLPPDAAASLIAAMETWDFDQAMCEAVIEGGWYRNADDKGDFCVRLDANPNFEPATIAPAVQLPPQPAALVTAAHAPPAAYDLKSVGLGAVGTFVMLVLIGVVWLTVRSPTESMTSLGTAVATPEQMPAVARRREAGLASPDIVPQTVEPTAVLSDVGAVGEAGETNAASTEGGLDPKEAVVTLDRPLPDLEPVTSGLSGLRMVAVPAEPTAAAPVAGTRDDQTPAAVPVDRQLAIGVPPPPVAQEVHPVLDRKRSLVTAATAHAVDIGPTAVAILSAPAPQNPSPVARGDVSSPPDGGAVGGGHASAPAVASPVEIPRARPARSATKSEMKARSSSRKRSARARSRAGSRAARARLRNAARHRKRADRDRHNQRASSPVQAQPNPDVVQPSRAQTAQGEPAAVRMLNGLSREWTTRALPSLLVRPGTADNR